MSYNKFLSWYKKYCFSSSCCVAVRYQCVGYSVGRQIMPCLQLISQPDPLTFRSRCIYTIFPYLDNMSGYKLHFNLRCKQGVHFYISEICMPHCTELTVMIFMWVSENSGNVLEFIIMKYMLIRQCNGYRIMTPSGVRLVPCELHIHYDNSVCHNFSWENYVSIIHCDGQLEGSQIFPFWQQHTIMACHFFPLFFRGRGLLSLFVK